MNGITELAGTLLRPAILIPSVETSAILAAETITNQWVME